MDISRINIVFEEEFENSYGAKMKMACDDRSNIYVQHEDNGVEYETLHKFKNVIIQEEEQEALMEFIQKHTCND